MNSFTCKENFVVIDEISSFDFLITNMYIYIELRNCRKLYLLISWNLGIQLWDLYQILSLICRDQITKTINLTHSVSNLLIKNCENIYLKIKRRTFLDIDDLWLQNRWVNSNILSIVLLPSPLLITELSFSYISYSIPVSFHHDENITIDLISEQIKKIEILCWNKKMIYLLSHSNPFPLYPGLHLHIGAFLPTLCTSNNKQSALTSQLRLHSKNKKFDTGHFINVV